MARARRHGRAGAQLRRHHRFPPRRPCRHLAHRPSQRKGQPVREAHEPGRPGARGDPRQRRGPLLLSRRARRPRRTAVVPQRVSVAVSATAGDAARVLRVPQGGDDARRRPRGAGVRLRAEGRFPLRPQVLGRHADRPAAQGASAERARRGDRAIRVPRRAHRCARRPGHGEALVAAGAAGLGGQGARPRQHRHPRDRLGRHQASPGLRQGRRGLPQPVVAQAPDRPPDVQRRIRRGVGVRRARRRVRASERALAARPAVRLHPRRSTTTSSPCSARLPGPPSARSPNP